jgi:hypothetical protein
MYIRHERAHIAASETLQRELDSYRHEANATTERLAILKVTSARLALEDHKAKRPSRPIFNRS